MAPDGSPDVVHGAGRGGIVPVDRCPGQLVGVLPDDRFLRVRVLDRCLRRYAGFCRRYGRGNGGRPGAAAMGGSRYYGGDLGGRRLPQRHRRIFGYGGVDVGAGPLGLCGQPDPGRAVLRTPHAEAQVFHDAGPSGTTLWKTPDRPAFFTGLVGGGILDGSYPHRIRNDLRHRHRTGYPVCHYTFCCDHAGLYSIRRPLGRRDDRRGTTRPAAVRLVPRGTCRGGPYGRAPGDVGPIRGKNGARRLVFARQRLPGQPVVALVGRCLAPHVGRDPLAGVLSTRPGCQK